jgi:hypothetical protein
MNDAPVVQSGLPAHGSGFARFLTHLLSDREEFFGEVADGKDLHGKIVHAAWTLVLLCGLYGAAAGAYSGPAQSLSAAIKLPVLFLGTLVICFPGFFVIQVLVGSRLRLAQVLALVMAALALSSIVLAAVVPVTVFFLLTGANYYFLELLHVVIVLGAGLVGMIALHEGLAFACEKRGVYPRHAMTIMRVWAVLFAFVGVQMAWNLRPFEGDRGQPFKVFRHYEGNFYTAIIYSFQKLSRGEDKGEEGKARSTEGMRSGLPEYPRGFRPDFPSLPDSAQKARP